MFHPATYTAPCGAVVTTTDLGTDGREVFVVALTACCGAAATGAPDNGQTVCKGCYRVVGDEYGTHGWRAAFRAAIDAACPCPYECADFAVHRVTE